jgi:hypothetical protein
MKTKSILFIPVFTLLTQLPAIGQNLLVKFDFLKDDFAFYEVKPGKPPVLIAKPVVGRNNTVKIEVINFNQFVFAARCSFESGEASDNTQVNFLSILAPMVLPQTGASFLAQFGKVGTPEESARGGLFSDPNASQSYLGVTESYNALYELERTIRNVDFSLSKLNELKYNRYLPTDSIKSMSNIMVTKILQKNSASHNDFADAIDRLTDAYNTNLSSFKLSSKEFDEAYDRYLNTRGGSSFIGQGTKENLKGLSEDVEKMETVINDNFIAKKMNLLENMYESIMNARFQFNASESAEKDYLNIKLEMFELPLGENGYPKAVSLDNLDAQIKTKIKKLKIVVKGDLKVNTSIGVAFPYYEDNTNFINKDSIIVGQSGNNYAPNITAFMNFYPYNGKLAQFGGTFGLGIPITEENRNMNVFLGASGLFGSKNRIVLNLGASLGQVNKLDDGNLEGDKLLSNTQEVPIRKVWQWGAFIGISFALSN